MYRIFVTLCVAAIICCAGGTQQYLLPKDIRPISYHIRLLYDLDPATNFSYFAAVEIELKAVQETSQIVLHAEGFTVPENSVFLRGDDAPRVSSVLRDAKHKFLSFQLDKNLRQYSAYVLVIPFQGHLRKGDLEGAYISSYVDKASKSTEYLVTTQFEAIAARKAFPCFDEPEYKATFTLDIGHPKGYNAISNMPVFNSTDENLLEDQWSWKEIEKSFKKDKSQFVWDRFEKSVPMSTYLVAYVISKFGHVQSSKNTGTDFRIWARNDVIDQANFSASIGPKVLSYFEKFYNVSFPLPKLDMIAIPDFSAGGMENWGLITYRETLLLYSQKQTSLNMKESIVSVIAHELAHQWFGNLVTMKWWSDLWLNEGFATYMAGIGVDAVEPSWQAKSLDAVEQMIILFRSDALDSSHPVSVPIDDPSRIGEIFDEISYKKGSIVIRMMSMFMGEDVFRRGVHNYLVKYSYSNAEQDDLWRELTATSMEYGGLARNVTVKQIMDTWTTQTGYPLITVTRDYTDSTLTVSQKRYVHPGSKASTAVSWWVPLRVLCEKDSMSQHHVQWLADTEGIADTVFNFEHGAKADEWVLFNYDMIAPYRVNYDQRNWKLLSGALSGAGRDAVPILGRVQLLSDALALAWTDQLHYHTALHLTNYLQHETEYLPLYAGFSELQKIDNVLKRSPDYGAFQKFIRQLITDQYHQAGGLSIKRIVNENDLLGVKMQTMTSRWACRAKVPGCEENAVELFNQWMQEDDPDANNPIPLDLRPIVTCVCVRRGSVREWRFVLERTRRAHSPAARAAALQALSCTHEVWIIKQFLEWTITDSPDVRRHEAARIIGDILSNNVGYYIAKEFVYTRIAQIHKALGDTVGSRLGSILKTMLNQFSSQNELDEFLKWKEEHASYLESSKLRISQGIEQAKVNIQWLAKNSKLVVGKLREFTSSSDTKKDLSLQDFVLEKLRDRNDKALSQSAAFKSVVLNMCLLSACKCLWLYR